MAQSFLLYHLGNPQLPSQKFVNQYSQDLQHIEVMSVLHPNLTIPNITVIGQDATAAFSPYLQDIYAFTTAAHSLQERRDDSCTQTVEVPVWYGPDYGTCSMQTMTAPCSISFPAASCHTHLPPSQTLLKNGLSETTHLWIIIGLSIFFVIFIPVAVLWARWKLRNRRRGGKRSISVQLEKNEGTRTKSKASSKSKAASKPTSTSPTVSGTHTGATQTPGRSSQIITEAMTYCLADGIRITNNINISTGRLNPTRSPETLNQQSDERRLNSPRIALESLRPGHPLGQAENQPWLYQDQNGRWVPREEGYLHPGLPPPLRQGGHHIPFVDQAEEARRARLHVPGAWNF